MQKPVPQSLLVLAALAVVLAANVSCLATEAAPLDSLLVRAERAIAADDSELGEELCRQALSVSRDAHGAQWGLAIIALRRGDPDEAVKRARKAVRGDGANTDYRMTLANAYGSKAEQGGLRAMFYGGKYKQEIETILEQDPEHIEANLGLMYYAIYAPPIVGGGLDKARERADIIASIDDYYGHLAHAVVAKRLGDMETAEAEYLAAVDADPANTEGRYVLGVFYLERDRPGDAVPVFESILELDPLDLIVVYQLAKAHLLSGDDLPAAERGFERFIASDDLPREPHVSSAHWRLAMVYERQARYNDAATELDTALSLDDDHEMAKEMKERLLTEHPELR